MADTLDSSPSKDVSRFMAEARGGQVTVDLEKWVLKLEGSVPRQSYFREGPRGYPRKRNGSRNERAPWELQGQA